MKPLEKFQADTEIGWDYAINNLYRRIVCKDTACNEDIILLAYISQYNTGYEYVEHNKVDDGICYQLRSCAMLMIQKVLETVSEVYYNE